MVPDYCGRKYNPYHVKHDGDFLLYKGLEKLRINGLDVEFIFWYAKDNFL
jgi:hypothetical protein